MGSERVEMGAEDTAANEVELLECLRRVGKGLIASGAAVGYVENTLTEIAQAHGATCEIMALPKFLVIKLGESSEGHIDFTVQRLTTMQLDQVSESAYLVDRLKRRAIPLVEAGDQMERILAKPPRWSPVTVILAYGLSCVGLTMLFRPEPIALLIAGVAGLVVGLLMQWFRERPRFDLLLRVVTALVE